MFNVETTHTGAIYTYERAQLLCFLNVFIYSSRTEKIFGHV